MLGLEYRMAPHGRLPAVVGNVGRRQAFGNERRSMRPYLIQPFGPHIFLLLFRHYGRSYQSSITGHGTDTDSKHNIDWCIAQRCNDGDTKKRIGKGQKQK